MKKTDLSFLATSCPPAGGDDPKKNDPLEFLGQPAEIQAEKPAPPQLPAPASADPCPRTRLEHLAFIRIRAAKKVWAWGLFDKERGHALATYLACLDARGKDVADRLQPGADYIFFEQRHAEAAAKHLEALEKFAAFQAAGGVAPDETDEEEAARRLAGAGGAAGAAAPPARLKIKIKIKGGGGGGEGGPAGQADLPPRSRWVK